MIRCMMDTDTELKVLTERVNINTRDIVAIVDTIENVAAALAERIDNRIDAIAATNTRINKLETQIQNLDLRIQRTEQ